MAELRRRDEEFNTGFGDRLREFRLREGVSQKELADRTYLSQSVIARIESGQGGSIESIRRILEALDCPLENVLLYQTDNEILAVSNMAKARSPQHCSVFLSYGGPDEPVARRFYDRFKNRRIKCFFFPESADFGTRLHRTMSDGVNEYDRVVLLCSQASLDRPGVLNEIEQVLIKEAAEGGNELVIPILLDDYMFSSWRPQREDVARQLKARVAADFQKAITDKVTFDKQFARLLEALEK